MYISTFVLRMSGTVTSQNKDLFSWDTLYVCVCFVGYCMRQSVCKGILDYIASEDMMNDEPEMIWKKSGVA
jgi:hypothetical protein